MKEYSEFLDLAGGLFDKLSVDVQTEKERCIKFYYDNEEIFKMMQDSIRKLEYNENDSDDELFTSVRNDIATFQDKTKYIENVDGVKTILDVLEKVDEYDISNFSDGEKIMKIVDGVGFSIVESSVGFIFKSYLVDKIFDQSIDGGFCHTYKTAFYSAILSNIHVHYCLTNILRIFLENPQVQEIRHSLLNYQESENITKH